MSGGDMQEQEQEQGPLPAGGLAMKVSSVDTPSIPAVYP